MLKPILGVFPDAVPVAEFTESLQRQAAELGFTKEGSLLMTGVCRDELCIPFVETLEDAWGPAFQIGSLGGLLFLGTTGLAAAAEHAPTVGPQRRYVVVAVTHLGLDGDGRPGLVRRHGQPRESAACGALMMLVGEIASGRTSTALDPADIEAGLLRGRVLRQLGRVPAADPLAVTLAARDAIGADFVRILHELHLEGRADVLLTTGVLVHTPDGDYLGGHRTVHICGDHEPIDVPLRPADNRTDG